EYLLYYYIAWTDRVPTSILREFDNYQTKRFSFNDTSFNQFNEDVFGYWNWCSESAKELGFVACQIMGICINATSVERLWSSMGHLHFVSRNRLKVSKFLKNELYMTIENRFFSQYSNYIR